MNRSTIAIILFLFGTFSAGTLGYHLIEGWGVLDSLYMTVITLTTVGFQEVAPLSAVGRIFTMVLILFGMGAVAYAFSYFAQEILSINFSERRRKKMIKKMGEFSGHIILVGYGRIGRVIYQELSKTRDDIIVIEPNPLKQTELDHLPKYFLEDDAANDEVLELAGIQRAEKLVCMVDSDADSLYITLASRALNSELFIISRANEGKARKKILRAGADKVVLPSYVSGMKVAHSVLNPAVDDLLDIGGSVEQSIQLAEIQIDEESKLLGKTLRNKGSDLEGIIVVGIRTSTGEFNFDPSADYAFQDGDVLITVSQPETLANVSVA